MSETAMLTGGAGYIGSHIGLALIKAGFKPIILGDFSNSSPAVLERLQRIAGTTIVSDRGGMADVELVKDMIHRHSIDAVIHVAGFKAVGESVAQLLKYYADPQCVFESCKKC